MSVNKIIVVIGVIFAIFIAFIFIQFNPFRNPKGPSVTIRNQTFSVTVADSEEKRQQGLSGQDSIGAKEGKLFVFDRPDTYAFWMKGMKFPLDIIFINDNKVVSITENVPPATDDNPPIYQPAGPSSSALEVNAGTAKKYNFKPGDKVTIIIPTPTPSPKK